MGSKLFQAGSTKKAYRKDSQSWHGRLCCASPPTINRRQHIKNYLVYGQVFGRGFAVLSSLKLVRNLLSFVQATEACALYGRDMYKYIFRTIFGLDETIAFGGVKPFYSTSSHEYFLSRQCGSPPNVVPLVNVHNVGEESCYPH
jgi:hypothetical protein